ncbi:MAG TPA: hypothetical protein VKV79_01660, partial [Terriglobia bacterium]|nr:hypothetical protein [Terriglobia bacterium]
MSSRPRRKNWGRTAFKIGLILLALDALAYAGMERPLASLLANKQNQFTATRLEWQQERIHLA